ncbi:uncharacterized protein LOC142326986 [Lycorma delicatula]|uniref:uncharacterized protein LOC142326986 n=1 Tax=Lycorma delicatula TaxID=130591 RepID=UPI003F50DADE
MLAFFIFLFSILCVYFYNLKDPEPIFGIYKQRGKWFFLKYIIIRTSLLWRKWQRTKTQKYSTSYREISFDDNIDQPQKLSELPQAFDAIFFIAASQDGYYVAAGSERRHHGIVNGLFYVVVPGKGILCSLKIPDTVLFGAKENQYGAEGLIMTPIEPMKKWHITFDGEMKLYNNPEKRFHVKFEADWSSNIKYFNFDIDLDDHLIAEALALQDWSKEYFEILEKHHQTHYEQMGIMNATFTIDGEEFVANDMGSFRDHSFGLERNWDLMHRYAFFMIFLEDGTKASVGFVCQPISCSVFNMGYVCLPSGQVDTLQWTDFKLYQNGENGIPPLDHAFQFKAGGKMYTVQVSVEHEVIHYVGWRWQAKMIERFVKFDVNGIKGRGMSEFNYSDKNRKRPDDVSINDPDWFKQLDK